MLEGNDQPVRPLRQSIKRDLELGKELSAKSDEGVPVRQSTWSVIQAKAKRTLAQPQSLGILEEDGTSDLSCGKRILKHNYFESGIALLIALNTVTMAFESQYLGADLGHDMGYPKYDQSAAVAWPGLSTVFLVVDYFFGVAFTVEVVFKLAVLRCGWICSFWNWFDFLIVAFWIIEKLSAGVLPFPTMALRVARLARLFRLLRLVRKIQGFDALFLMTTAMKGSVNVLLWSAVLLLVFQLMIAMVLNHMLTDFMSDPDVEMYRRQVIFEYFGSCSRALLTMFEITLGNWPPVARLLQEHVDEGYVAFALIHKLTIGFAVIGVINGVFMQETMNVASSDDQLMMRQRERAQRLHTKKMEALFALADESGDGLLDYQEFMNILVKPEVKSWLAAQGLDVSDAELMFVLMDDGDEQISADELVKAASKLKGPARSIDLHNLMMEHDDLKKLVLEIKGNAIPSAQRKSLKDKAMAMSASASMTTTQSHQTTRTSQTTTTSSDMVIQQTLPNVFVNSVPMSEWTGEDGEGSR